MTTRIPPSLISFSPLCPFCPSMANIIQVCALPEVLTTYCAGLCANQVIAGTGTRYAIYSQGTIGLCPSSGSVPLSELRPCVHSAVGCLGSASRNEDFRACGTERLIEVEVYVYPVGLPPAPSDAAHRTAHETMITLAGVSSNIRYIRRELHPPLP